MQVNTPAPLSDLGMLWDAKSPPFPPKKIITSAFFSGKSLPENLGLGIIPKKIQVSKKISRHGFFPWFFPHPWGTTKFAPPAANEAYSAACLFEGPQGWGMGMIGQFVSASSQEKAENFHMAWIRESLSGAYIFIEYVREENTGFRFGMLPLIATLANVIFIPSG